MAKFKRISYRKKFRRSMKSHGMVRNARNLYLGRTFSTFITGRTPLYVRQVPGLFGYTLSNGTFSYLTGLYTLVRSGTGMQQLNDAYSYVRIKGIQLKFIRSLNIAPSNTVQNLPQVYIDCIGELNSTALTTNTITESDTAFSFQPINADSYSPSRYWKMPNGFIVGGDGFPVGGRSAWIPTRNFELQSAYQIYIAIGSHPFTSPPLASDATIEVGTIECKIYMDFAKKIPLNTN